MKFIKPIFYFVLFSLLSLSLIACSPRYEIKKLQEDFRNGRQNFLLRNYETARIQLQRPAERGNVEAQYAMGYIYYNGLGTPANEKIGVGWIERSANGGYEPAQVALEKIQPQKDKKLEMLLRASEVPAPPPSKKAKMRRKAKPRYFEPRRSSVNFDKALLPELPSPY